MKDGGDRLNMRKRGIEKLRGYRVYWESKVNEKTEW